MNPSRVPAGVTTGGQFAAGARAESTATLAPPRPGRTSVSAFRGARPGAGHAAPAAISGWLASRIEIVVRSGRLSHSVERLRRQCSASSPSR